MDEILYTVKEIAEKLKVHPKTVQGYIRSGELKALKIGKDWRVPKKVFQKWLMEKLGESDGVDLI